MAEVNFTICEQCDRCVAFSDLEDHLFAHELDQGHSDSGNTLIKVTKSTTNHDEESMTVTEGIIPVLSRFYVQVKPAGIKTVSLSADTSHVSSTQSDFGWGCGYRNIQMMFSSLLELEPYKSILIQKGLTFVPSIQKIQDMIEKAWSEGFDPKGRLELNSKVKMTKKWIGTTEAASVFRMLGINTLVVDFASPTGANGTHPIMFEWITNYFKTGRPMNQSSDTSDRSQSDKDYPPLYLQHEGHSRTVIGLEERDGSVVLLLLDPSHNQRQFHKVLMDPRNCIQLLRKTIDRFVEKEYEIVFVDGLLDKKQYEEMKVISPYQRFPSN